MKGTYVDLTSDDGGSFRGYLSLPDTQKGPGLVLLQEIFGINENMRSVADQYAKEGYIAIVPDLYWRMEPGLDIPYGAENFERARSLGLKLDLDLAIKDILSTARNLKNVAKGLSGDVGVVGFCLGGLLTFLTAARTNDEVSCAVSYYGVKLDSWLQEAKNVQCPIMFHFGGKDPYSPPELIQQVKQAFEGSACKVDVFSYEDAGHAFSAPLRPDHYHKASAELAHQRSVELLNSVLKPN